MGRWDLQQKRAVVTGGSKGIGKAIVRELLDLGAEVLFTGRDEVDLQAALHEFRSRSAGVHVLAGDVRDPEHRNAISAWVKQHWHTLDILVNSAGINIRKASSEYTTEEYSRVLEVNLVAPFELSRRLFPLLEGGGQSAVINVASVAGTFDAQTGAPYGMSKAGLVQLSRNLAKEWADANVRVNSVSPWFTETPMIAKLLADPQKRSVILSRTPMGRVAKVEEVAAAVAFLAMDAASFITGQNLTVDGGATVSIL